MSTASEIANLIINQGNIRADALNRIAEAQARAQVASAQAQAQAQQNTGQIWGQTLQSLGQIPMQVYGQIKNQQTTALENQQRQQQLQMGAMQIDQAQRQQQAEKALGALMQGGQQPGPNDAGPQLPSYLDDQGLFDIPKLTARMGQLGYGDLTPKLIDGAEKINDSITKHQEAQQTLARQQTIMTGDLASGVLQMVKTTGTPIDQAMDFVVSPALARKQIDPAQYAQIKQQILSLPPDKQEAGLTALMDAAAKVAPTKTLAEGGAETDRYGRVVASGAPKPPTKWSVLMQAAGGDPNKAIALAATPKTDEFSTFQNIWAANQAGIGKTWTDLTPQQQLAGWQAFRARGSGATQPGGVEDYVSRWAQEHNKTPDQLTTGDLQTALAGYHAAERKPTAVMQTVDPDSVAYWVRQIQNDPTQFSMLNSNKPLQNAVQEGLAKAGVNLDKISAQSRQMAETAQDILPEIDRVKQEAADLDKAGLMGPIRGRWRDLAANKLSADQMFGSPVQARKVGQFLTDVGLLETAAGRAHGGARGGGSPAMLDHMKSIMDPGTKDLSVYLGNLDSVGEWMRGYANVLPINRQDGGGNTAPPAGAKVRSWNPTTGKFE